MIPRSQVRENMQVWVSRNSSDNEEHRIRGIVKSIISPPPGVEYDKNGTVVRLIDGQIGTVVKIIDHEDITESEILHLLSAGETQNVEFKETFSVANDTHEQIDCLRDQTVKEIAAIMNGRGGTLFIGINDAGEVTGLEPDYKYVIPKRSTQTIQDKFKQEIHSYVKDKLMDTTLEEKYVITIKNIQNQDIAVIQISSSEKPVFVEEKIKFIECVSEREKKGTRQLFYIRTDSGTLKLDSREILHYWNTRNSN